jgi:hypothetical protein
MTTIREQPEEARNIGVWLATKSITNEETRLEMLTDLFSAFPLQFS